MTMPSGPALDVLETRGPFWAAAQGVNRALALFLAVALSRHDSDARQLFLWLNDAR